MLAHGPNLGWYDVPVGAILREDLGGSFPVVVDNEGNLAAAAEVIPGDAGRQDILALHGEIGVGGGIVSGGRLLRGEAMVSPGSSAHDRPARRASVRMRSAGLLGAVTASAPLELSADPDGPIRNPATALDDRLAEVNRRAHLGDARTLQALEDVGVWGRIGAAILVNALIPGPSSSPATTPPRTPHADRDRTDLRAGVLARTRAARA